MAPAMDGPWRTCPLSLLVGVSWWTAEASGQELASVTGLTWLSSQVYSWEGGQETPEREDGERACCCGGPRALLLGTERDQGRKDVGTY